MIEIDRHYPEEDSPWTLWFNGEPMPRWSNCWHLIPVLDRAEEFMRDWEDNVGYEHFWRLQCRMDHCGVIESEEPETFRLCCLAFAFLMLRDEAAILDELAAAGSKDGSNPSEIFCGVRDGLFAMHRRCLDDGIAFWTSGYEADRDSLREAIRRCSLPATDPDRREAPHLLQNRSEAELRIRFIRSDLLSLVRSRNLPKDVRKLVHELPRNS